MMNEKKTKRFNRAMHKIRLANAFLLTESAEQ